MYLLTPLEWVVVALIAVGLVTLPLYLDTIERRRRRSAWHRYFHGGGLVRSLMSRWKAQPRLTDKRVDKRVDKP